jgi:chemotaxis protein histidine kinase CheA
MSFDKQRSSLNLDFIFMSSENEMIDPPGDDKPEIESQTHQSDPTADPLPDSTSEEQAPEEEFEDGWEAWISTNPEEGDVVDSFPESIAEPDTGLSDEETTEAAAERNAEPSQEEMTETAAEQNAETSQEEMTETAVEQNAETSQEETTEAVAERNAEPSQEEMTETAVEQNAEPIDEETIEAVEESETVLDTDEKPNEQEREETPTPPIEAEPPEAAEEVSEETDADEPEPPAPKPSKPKKVRRDGLTTEHVITYFAPCGRCGFFLSGYRATYGLDDLETAVSEAKSGWLTLTWGQEMQELILKSYGSRIEANDLLFDGCCSECRRAFVYKSARSEKKPATFRIEIKPRKRQ